MSDKHKQIVITIVHLMMIATICEEFYHEL